MFSPFPQREALIRLLQDDDPATIKLVKEQLAIGGMDNLPALRDLLASDNEKVSQHVSSIIHGIHEEKAVADFAAYCRHFKDDSDIETAGWLLAQALIPGLNPKPYLLKLNHWGRRLTTILESAISDRERVEILARFMSQSLNFRGNDDDYYNPRNSLLPSVMDTRCGIPISLALIYMLVARRAGMLVEGINLPGHFIARHGDIFFDPFHSGKILTLQDCREILIRQNLELEPGHLMTAPARAWLVRVLANLLFIYERASEIDHRERVLNWLAALDCKPGSAYPGSEAAP